MVSKSIYFGLFNKYMLLKAMHYIICFLIYKMKVKLKTSLKELSWRLNEGTKVNCLAWSLILKFSINISCTWISLFRQGPSFLVISCLDLPRLSQESPRPQETSKSQADKESWSPYIILVGSKNTDYGHYFL